MGAWILAAPPLLALAAALVALLLDAASQRRAAVTVVVLGLACGSLAGVIVSWRPVSRLGGVFSAGGQYSMIGALVLGLGAAAVLSGWRAFGDTQRGGQSAALAALSAAAGVGAVWTNDLMMLVLLLEASSLAAYALTAAADTDGAREAAMKYFIQGAIATTLFVFGVAMLLAQVGGLGFSTITPAVGGDLPLLASFALLASALAFKVGAFPFHSWAPDVYEQSQAPSAAFMASAPKLAALVAAGVLLRDAYATGNVRIEVVVMLAGASIAFGNFAALGQRSLRRLLAYSGIAQMGYAVVGLVAQGAITPVVVYGAVYGVAAVGAFAACQAVSDAEPDWDGSVGGLGGLARRRPLLAAAVAVTMLSLTGIPLTAGFWAKYVAFTAAINAGWTWLAIVGVVGSVVSFGYYGRVLRAMYLAGGEGERAPARPAPATGVAVTAAALLLVVGVVPLALGVDWIFALLRLA